MSEWKSMMEGVVKQSSEIPANAKCRKDIESEFSLSTTSAKNKLKQLVKDGLLRIVLIRTKNIVGHFTQVPYYVPVESENQQQEERIMSKPKGAKGSGGCGK